MRRFKKKFGKVAVSTDSDEVNISNINSYDSLSVETDSGDISLTHEAMPDNLSCHISSGSDDVTVQLKNAEFSTDTDGCKDGSIEKRRKQFIYHEQQWNSNCKIVLERRKI